jgi:hypothetical protein
MATYIPGITDGGVKPKSVDYINFTRGPSTSQHSNANIFSIANNEYAIFIPHLLASSGGTRTHRIFLTNPGTNDEESLLLWTGNESNAGGRVFIYGSAGSILKIYHAQSLFNTSNASENSNGSTQNTLFIAPGQRLRYEAFGTSGTNAFTFKGVLIRYERP